MTKTVLLVVALKVVLVATKSIVWAALHSMLFVPLRADQGEARAQLTGSQEDEGE